MRINIVLLFSFTLFLGMAGCSPSVDKPIPGPDKQGAGLIEGSAVGAGAGAVYGAQVTSATGPGAFIGAGFGALAGAITGFGTDQIEEEQLRTEREQRRLQEISWAQEVIAENYAMRLEMHPNRDIYPADLFFDGDSHKLKPEAKILARELGKMTRDRMPWSRIVIASYVTADAEDSEYANFVSAARAKSIALGFIKSGVEPRRVLTKGVVVSEPIFVDPEDTSDRYRQAIEIIALDK
jgi:outer membrane protein OmpA-like peptidoglycan-associated protein